MYAVGDLTQKASFWVPIFVKILAKALGNYDRLVGISPLQGMALMQPGISFELEYEKGDRVAFGDQIGSMLDKKYKV